MSSNGAAIVAVMQPVPFSKCVQAIIQRYKLHIWIHYEDTDKLLEGSKNSKLIYYVLFQSSFQLGLFVITPNTIMSGRPKEHDYPSS